MPDMDASTLESFVRSALAAQGYRFDEARIKEIILQFSRIAAAAEQLLAVDTGERAGAAAVFRP
jgi:Asp-tRNA(Asn)/Glu-tRNA(Gln) amidotransferase C subunit